MQLCTPGFIGTFFLKHCEDAVLGLKSAYTLLRKRVDQGGGMRRIESTVRSQCPNGGSE